MLHFRNMVLEDINVIYENEILRPLITVPPIGEKFGVIIDNDGELKGGATGYIDKDEAVIQKIIVDDLSQSELLKEGLIRSVIYILERNGVKTIFIDKSEENICRKVGFQEWIGGKRNSLLFIDTEKFFEKPCCNISI